MRAFFLGVAVAAFASGSLGCGMITGLSNDYTFAPEDGGTSGSDAGDAGAADGSTTDDGGKCDVPSGVVACNCLPKTCCPLATCLRDADCITYMQCRQACGHNESCQSTCKENASSNSRNLYDRAVSNCGAQSCFNSCTL